MKIAFDIRSLGYTQKRTGVEELTYQLAKHLPHLGKKHSFIFFYNAPINLSHLKELARPNNVTLVNLKRPNLFLNLSIQFLGRPKIDRLLPQKPDLVLVPSYRPLALATGIKKVTIFHDLTFEYFPHFLTPKIHFWHWYINPKKQALTSNQIIAVSQTTKNDLIQTYQIDPQKITVIYHGVDPTGASEEKSVKIASRLNLPKDFILTLGTVEPRKNLNRLIKAFKLLKQELKLPLKLVIAGKKGWIKKKDFKLLNDPAIIYLEYVSLLTKKVLYQLATIFVLPSFYEGFGLPALEAMSLGTPVITSNVSALPEITQDSALLINPYNTKEIKTGLKTLIQSPHLRKILIQKGKKRSQMFTWEKCAQKTLTVLEQIN